MKKRILITGGSGFLGSHLVSCLKKRNYIIEAPSSRELDVISKDAFDKYLDVEIDFLVHIAGKTSVPKSWADPLTCYSTNVMGTINALEFCRKKGIGMTYISGYLYGVPRRLPVAENDEIKPNNPYASSKAVAEEACRYYAELFNMDITVLRLFNMYGSGQNDVFLVPNIIKQLENGTDIVVDNPLVKRDFTYVGDSCEAIELTIQQTKGFEVFNVGSGIEYTVEEIVKRIQTIVGKKGRIVSSGERHAEIQAVRADISKIKHYLGWEPHTSLEDGLKIMLGKSHE